MPNRGRKIMTILCLALVISVVYSHILPAQEVLTATPPLVFRKVLISWERRHELPELSDV